MPVDRKECPGRPELGLSAVGTNGGTLCNLIDEHGLTYSHLRRHKRDFREIFATFSRHFAKFSRIFASFRSFRRFGDVLGPVRTYSDAFGHVRIRWEAFGSVRTLSDFFDIFSIFFALVPNTGEANDEMCVPTCPNGAENLRNVLSQAV